MTICTIKLRTNKKEMDFLSKLKGPQHIIVYHNYMISLAVKENKLLFYAMSILFWYKVKFCLQAIF